MNEESRRLFYNVLQQGHGTALSTAQGLVLADRPADQALVDVPDQTIHRRLVERAVVIHPTLE